MTRRAWLFCRIVLGLSAALMLFLSIFGFYVDYRFARGDLGRASATVEQLTPGMEGGHPDFNVSFHYVVGHHTFLDVMWPVTQATGNSLHVGGALPVEYLESSPRLCRIDLPIEEAVRKNDSFDLLLISLALGSLYFLNNFAFRRALAKRQNCSRFSEASI